MPGATDATSAAAADPTPAPPSPPTDRLAVAAAAQRPEGQSLPNCPSVLFPRQPSTTPSVASVPAPTLVAPSTLRRNPQIRHAAAAARAVSSPLPPAAIPLPADKAVQLRTILEGLSQRGPRIERSPISDIIRVLPSSLPQLRQIPRFGKAAVRAHGPTIIQEINKLHPANSPSNNNNAQVVTPSSLQEPLITRAATATSGRRRQTPLGIGTNPNIVVISARKLAGKDFKAVSTDAFTKGAFAKALQRYHANFDLRTRRSPDSGDGRRARAAEETTDHIRGRSRFSLEDAMRVPVGEPLLLLILDADADKFHPVAFENELENLLAPLTDKPEPGSEIATTETGVAVLKNLADITQGAARKTRAVGEEMEVVPEARLDVRAMAGDEEDDKEEGGEDESGAEEDAEAAGVGDDGVDEEGVVGEQNEAEEDDGEAEAEQNEAEADDGEAEVDDAAASDEEDGGSKVQPTTAVAPGRPRHVNIRVRDEEGKPITRKVQYRRRQYKPRAATDIFAFGMKEMKRKNVKRRRQKQAEPYRRKRDAIAEMYATQEAMAQRSDVLQPLMEQDLKMPVAHRVALRSLWEDAGNEVAFSSEP